MISNKIIGGLKPHNKVNATDTSTTYFMAIKDVEDRSNQDVCKEGVITFTLVQVNQNLNNLINTESTTKELTIKGLLNSDENNIFSVDLLGYERAIQTTVEEQEEFPNSHYIEMIETSLSREITINFNYAYADMPSIIINIDKQYEKLYKSYSTDFIMETATEYNPNKETQFTGVKIIFNNLKVKKSYPLIKITVIGDTIINETSTSTTTSSTETTPTSLTFKVNGNEYQGTIANDGVLTIPSKHIFVDGDKIPIVVSQDTDIKEKFISDIEESTLVNKQDVIDLIEECDINETYSGRIINGKGFIIEACNDSEGAENDDNSNSS